MAHSATVDSATAIRCLEFVQSVVDTINTNEGRFLHFPLYGKSSLFSKAHVPSADSVDDMVPAGDHGTAVGAVRSRRHAYSITRYIYCTVTGIPFMPTGTSWIGYIAESTEEESARLGKRDIVVAIRGTMDDGELIKDIDAGLADFQLYVPSGGRVHEGFLSIYTSTSSERDDQFGEVSMRDQIHKELVRLLGANIGGGAVPHGKTVLPVSITMTGHSLGGALAILVACDVGYNIAVKYADVTVSAITSASPKVGDDDFKATVEKYTAFICRYCNIGDPVPSLPLWLPTLPYVHAGTELTVHWALSPYVSVPKAIRQPHTQELYMHAIAAQNSVAVYTTMPEGLFPDLPEVPADFAEDRISYFVIYICRMSAWNDEDRGLLKQHLDAVKEYLKEDQQALEQYLREVAYIIGRTRDKGDTRNTSAPLKHRQLAMAHDITRLHSDQASPFDQRDYSLLNKNADILKEEYNVPSVWLVHPNKDMVLDPVSQRWLPRINRPSDIPTPDNPEYN